MDYVPGEVLFCRCDDQEVQKYFLKRLDLNRQVEHRIKMNTVFVEEIPSAEHIDSVIRFLAELKARSQNNTV